MPIVMVTLRDGFDFSAEMGRMRNWFDAQRCTPSGFNYRQDGTSLVIEVRIEDENIACRFKQIFGGQDSLPNGYERRFSHETMETVCWWRLRAEEIRAAAEDYRSREAKKTMAEVALSYDRMAENLEKRLTNPRYCRGWIVP